MKKINIAIDGYSSCGKSTMAKALAKELHYVYVDSGAMYRAVTLFALRNNFIVNGEVLAEKLVDSLDKAEVHLERMDGNMYTFLNDENVEDEIRTMEISSHVSNVSTIKEVRQHLQKIQHKMSKRKGVVMDGRDIGTAVLPNAELKIFMTADKPVRTERRYQELKEKGIELTREEVEQNLSDRDYKDTHRKENPLVQASDARILDSTHLNREEQLSLAMKWTKEVIAAV